MTSNGIKIKDALNSAKRIIKAYQEWQRQDGPNAHWQGGVTKQISQELDMVIRRETDALADGDPDGNQLCLIEEGARGLALCVDNVARSHQKWLQDASMSLPTAPPGGSDELHRVLVQLEDQLKKNSLPNPPPIEQLQRQNVSPNQIAIIYGWKTEDGSPDTSKVFEEIDKPGTHYDEKKWVHPAERSIRAEINKRWETRIPRPKLFSHEAANATAVEEKNPQLPSLEELLEIKAPVGQIMRLHDMTEDEVLAAARDRGINLEEPEAENATTQIPNSPKPATTKSQATKSKAAAKAEPATA